MALPSWHEEAIEKHHRRAAFECGEPELDTYLARHARKAHERGAAKTFLAIADDAPGEVLGIFTSGGTTAKPCASSPFACPGESPTGRPWYYLSALTRLVE